MKDLGYMNGWAHETKDGTFFYSKEKYPEYCNCREQKHTLKEISHSHRGSDTEYICPICDICWHVDLSD